MNGEPKLERSHLATEQRKLFVQEGIPDIFTVPIPEDKDVESYALASILIEHYWVPVEEFFQRHPVELIELNDFFWENFYNLYRKRTAEFRDTILREYAREACEKKDAGQEISFEEKALLRYMQIKNPGFPSMDDLFLFQLQFYRMLTQRLTVGEAREVDTERILLEFMTFGRPQLMLLLLILYKENNLLAGTDDIANEFEWDNFSIENGEIRIASKAREKFNRALPQLLSRLEEKGHETRILKCPVLYSKKGTAQSLIRFVRKEIQRQYFDRVEESSSEQ